MLDLQTHPSSASGLCKLDFWNNSHDGLYALKCFPGAASQPHSEEQALRTQCTLQPLSRARPPPHLDNWLTTLIYKNHEREPKRSRNGIVIKSSHMTIKPQVVSKSSWSLFWPCIYVAVTTCWCFDVSTIVITTKMFLKHHSYHTIPYSGNFKRHLLPPLIMICFPLFFLYNFFFQSSTSSTAKLNRKLEFLYIPSLHTHRTSSPINILI